MIRTGFYNEDKDVSAVDQIGFVDVAEAVKNGQVIGSVEDAQYDNIEDPDGLMNNADDIFALYRQADYIKGFTPSESETTEHTE